ncbi:radical SAM protein [candidate division KSB1 bacterium]|nr:radical SAM protein [candidate division KSB1 bacterium]NIR69357.1 radical SAM protein [candidate division KSB1 bacterium]NIS24175.1 radical SAM protein [candidate division KSB1 bacterium]NIT71090.1 radical SAM protein [candidate division KSB1 bacterium]NIU24794.1 radical SAM protein [candidate division KSB1 bacterium]
MSPANGRLSKYFHPCLDEVAHRKVGRIHLPVAPLCNIHCNYCERRLGCANEHRPGTAAKVISPVEAVEVAERALSADPRNRVIGIAGPGDPLANEATFETLKRVRDKFSDITRCVCTNGLYLPQNVSRLKALGVQHLTITMNAVDAEIGARVHPFVRIGELINRGLDGIKLLQKNQQLGLKEAARNGMIIKINSVIIPEVNMLHLPEVAKKVKELGAHIMNLMPLIPLGRFKNLRPPTCEELRDIREECEKYMPQFRACIQCSADAIGVPGESRSVNSCSINPNADTLVSLSSN